MGVDGNTFRCLYCKKISEKEFCEVDDLCESFYCEHCCGEHYSEAGNKIVKGHDPECGRDYEKERDEYLATKEEMVRIKKVFEDLRKIGYATLEGGICCHNCAISEINKKYKNPKKYAFYHDQDIGDKISEPDRMFDMETGNFIGLHIGWDGKGKDIVDIAKKNGFRVEWNGRKDTKIRILN